jgi:hypothetical protein
MLGDVDGLVSTVTAFAGIGSDGRRTTSPSGSFEGFDGFVSQGNQKKSIEAHVHASGLVAFRPVTTGRYPQPTGFRTVLVGYGKDQVRYTAAHHHAIGINYFGQKSVEFPICLVNLAAWRRTPCDLRLTRWFRTEEEAIDEYQPKAPVPPVPEPSACAARFDGDVSVELRRESSSRWLMWEVKGGRRTRRADFASPSLDHAKATATHWYGEPVGEWQALTDAARRQTRRK